ncbi:hypothetical protein [Wielerella bovis]|uniref:hypothetical protein n=1 Tax=Wielerella bovis TaxID=2917790 RepID=UPI0020195FCE|nr:hypothetical protein [Wielerella bovis]ULJ65941.1 hypothetical protein MIS31_06565 [Wielerella bovis]
MSNPRPQTTLTQQDLRIYASERLTDTPDGGGEMTSRALTGAVNELFPVVSDFARVNGQVNARQVYPAVLKPIAAALWGANMILDEPSQSPYVSYLLAEADYYGQERASLMERLEGYRVPVTETRMTLLGLQRRGSRLVQVYQRESVALPVVGQCFALTQIENGNPIYEFFRVESLTSSLQVFEDDKGEFVRRVVKMVTQSPLERDFQGLDEPSRYRVRADARVLDTQIADSAKYYGIKPLAAPVLAGSASIKVPSIYEQLVPVSTVETAIADDWASGRLMWIETAPRRVVYSGYRYMNSGSLFLETPVLPASVQMDGGWEDDGAGSLKRGEQILNIDYANGVISGFNGVPINSISAIPAVQVRNYAYSAVVEINEVNIGTEFAPLLRPKPAKGSVAADFISGGEWYQLADNGDSVLRDAQQQPRGNVSKNGSAVVSLPVLPDANSQLILTWAPRDFYKNFDGSEAGEAILPSNLSSVFRLPETPKSSLKPNSIRLSWNNGMAQTASDQNGKLSGDATGWVDYAAGLVYPDAGLRAAAVQIRAEQYIGAIVRKNVSVKDGDVMTFSAGARIQAGTLAINMPIGRLAKPNAQPVYPTPSLPTPRRLSTSI